jgi:copper chaperone CopZ
MKKYLLPLILLFSLTVSTHTHAETSMENDIEIKVSGMSCEECSKTLDDLFTREESVQDVTVDLENQLVSIDTIADQTIEDDKIQEIVDWAGFDLINIKRL